MNETYRCVTRIRWADTGVVEVYDTLDYDHDYEPPLFQDDDNIAEFVQTITWKRN